MTTSAQVQSCQNLPVYPEDVPPSEHYRELFNREAQKLGYPITWVQDSEGGQPNIPDISYGEVRIKDGSTFEMTADVICDVRRVVEGKRLKVVEASRGDLAISSSQTLSDPVMDMANTAEQRWLAFVSDNLQEASLDIYGQQANYPYAELKSWMAAQGDANSRFHFDRMRVPAVPPVTSPTEARLMDELNLDKNAAESPTDYANVFPWFQDEPHFNAMLPKDMAEDDKAYISANYDKDNPIRLPWTVVEEVDSTELKRLAKGSDIQGDEPSQTIELKSTNGQPIMWLVKGRGDKWYKVTNAVFHPAYDEYFQTFSATLREAAVLPPVLDGDETYDLDPEFKRYTLAMANFLEQGNFHKLLEEDLNQTQGNLFLTFFPHEGYWSDGIKFPFMLEMGIRDSSSGNLAEKEASAFQDLENRAGELAAKNGLTYHSRTIDLEDVSKSAILFWPYRTGGFMRAYQREPVGHDYPKREYPGITLHRNVVLLDALTSALPATNIVAKELIDPSGETEITHWHVVDDVMWHEGTHGTGARPDTPTNSGRTMSDVYGDFWGTIAEPLADAGAILSAEMRFNKGVLTEEERSMLIKTTLVMQFRRYIPKAKATGAYFGNPDAPHLVGSDMLVGWLFLQEAIRVRPDGQSVAIDDDKFMEAVAEFFEQLTLLSLTDDLEGLKEFVRSAVNGTPDEFEQRILEVKDKYVKPGIVNRNPNPRELMSVVK